jgi:alpha-beta hydrolase superfamily lysophospholipase
MKTLHAELPSWDGKTQLALTFWHVSRPRAIVQLTHGMAECIERYDEFARALCVAGFAVIGYDLLAHGDSVTDESEWGHYDRHGLDHLLADIDSVRQLGVSAFGDEVPYVLLGHSMGSFLVRVYLAEHGTRLAGAILCGTGNPSVATSRLGHALATGIGLVRGMHHRSKLVDGMAIGSYSEHFEPARTSCDWLSTNVASVDDYIADPRDGFMFTMGGYRMLTHLTSLAARKSTFQGAPVDLPLYIISGTEDPVGDFGEGPREVSRLYRETGHRDVTLKLYGGDRHEILQELDRDDVFADVIAWIETHVLTASRGSGRMWEPGSVETEEQP